jgi:hypothetical protein
MISAQHPDPGRVVGRQIDQERFVASEKILSDLD